MSMLRIMNPATGTVVRELPSDSRAQVEEKVARASVACRMAHPAALGANQYLTYLSQSVDGAG